VIVPPPLLLLLRCRRRPARRAASRRLMTLPPYHRQLKLMLELACVLRMPVMHTMSPCVSWRVTL